MKADRRRREQDDINNEKYANLLKQQSLANANTERAYNYGVARDTQQDKLDAEAITYNKQRNIDQDVIAADQVIADKAWRATSDENSDQSHQLGLDNAAATLAQRGIDNKRNVKTDARYQTTADQATSTFEAGQDTAAAADNAVRFRGLMTQMATTGSSWDEMLDSPGGSEQVNQIIRTNPYLRKTVKSGGNPTYEPHSVTSVQTGVDAQGQPIMGHALMIQVGENKDGSPILKPYSQFRGTDDAVEYMGTDKSMAFLEQIVLGGTAKGTQSGINSAAGVFADAANTSAQQSTSLGQVPVATASVDTGASTTSLGGSTESRTDEPITLNLGTPAPVGLDTTTAPDTGTGRGTSVPNPEEIKQGQAISQIVKAVVPQDYSQMSWADKDRIDSEVVSQLGASLDISRSKATRLYGQWQTTGNELNGVVEEKPESLFNGFGQKPKPKPKVDSKLTASETKGLAVFDSALTLNNGTNQAIANKAAKDAPTNPTDSQITAAQTTVEKEVDTTTPVDTSSKGIAKRAAAYQVLNNAGLISNLDEAQAVNWYANGTLGANTIGQTTVGNNVISQEVDSFDQQLGTSVDRSPAARTRDATLSKEQRATAATQAADGFKRAVETGAANGMGTSKKDGQPTGYYGDVKADKLPGYMTQMFETNADIFASIVPEGMDINNMTGTPRENAVVAALTSSAVQALKAGHFPGKDGQRAGSAAGNIMPLLALYPPASDTGVYVFGGQIHYLEDKVKDFAARNKATEHAARQALKQIYGAKAALERENNISATKKRNG
jgi:hypothetical protein